MRIDLDVVMAIPRVPLGSTRGYFRCSPREYEGGGLDPRILNYFYNNDQNDYNYG